MQQSAIAYIIPEFPSHTETFILKEVLAVSKAIPLYIIVLKKGNGRLDPLIYEAIGSKLIYIPSLLSWKFLKTFGKAFLHKRKLIQQDRESWNIFKYGLTKVLRKIKLLSFGLYAAEQLKNLPIRHIHSHFANYPTDIAIIISQLTGITYSFTAHAHDIYVKNNYLLFKVQKAMFVITCTNHNKEWIDSLLPKDTKSKVYLIYHGVDVNFWNYRERNNSKGKREFSLLCVGRLVEKKGFIYLLGAIRTLLEEGFLVRLNIIGKGKEEKYLKKYCRKYQISQFISFLGWKSRDQIQNLYNNSDVLVMPSIITADGDRDGIPNVILEAMAVGIPVISTFTSGIPELIKNHQNGLMVPEKDIYQLVLAIKRILLNNELTIMLTKNAHSTIEQKFNDCICSEQLINLFQQKIETVSLQ